ncbi:putative uncharacterized protein DDB_G0287113 isoform X1 [Strongylocentrotus purpuratus]|uniref:LEM domain-containing protein n=1 Tax=Strongylocentrotus purpuratus TaxID=7668 RepID=A0A7M7HLX6_STRPU|nr:putative uncharacterized protein DDB_G0287113 isoform X1 [Strongylocentrotus purpuratus]|eukprot:XP_011665583.1 PREDICTED: putative uncharacterized protein DDB_G0287113 isoform X1 [Strongylocentrotus purpuratus]
MSSIGEDPWKLTISQLKTQLKRLGVQAPKDARKAEYVRLYESSVKASRTQSARRATPRRAPVKSQAQRSEFSSDEEAEPASKVIQMPRKGKSNPKDEKMERNLDTVQRLTDKELREELSYYNISAAITDTTRGAYEKKLAGLMTNPPAQPPKPKQVEVEEEEETEEEEEEEEFSDSEPEETEEEEEGEEEEEEKEEEKEFSDFEPEEVQTPRISAQGDHNLRQTPTRRRAAAAERVNQEQQTSPAKTEVVVEEEGGISFWVQLLILLFIAFAVFLIWYFNQNGQDSGTPGVTKV